MSVESVMIIFNSVATTSMKFHPFMRKKNNKIKSFFYKTVSRTACRDFKNCNFQKNFLFDFRPYKIFLLLKLFFKTKNFK